MFSRIVETIKLRRRSAPTFHVMVVVEEEVFCPVTYVRVVNHLQHAPEGWSAEIYVLPREVQIARERLRRASLVLMARCVTPEALDIASRARNASIPIVYDIDDYLWRLPEYLDKKEGALAIDQIIQQATVVTTPSEALGRFITQRISGPTIALIPNAADLPMPESPRGDLTAVMANSDFFRLAGSKQALFEAMRDAARAADRRVWLYYLSNDPPEYCTDDPHLQIVWCGVRAYTSYKAILERIKPELAVIALPDDHFSCYKSVVKFAEFGAVSAAGVFSNVEPYKSFVRSGVDGWLTGNSPDEWRRTFEQVFSLSPDQLIAIRDQARERVMREFAAADIRQQFFSTLSSLGAKKLYHDDKGNAVPRPRTFTFGEAYGYIVDVWRNSTSHRKA